MENPTTNLKEGELILSDKQIDPLTLNLDKSALFIDASMNFNPYLLVPKAKEHNTIKNALKYRFVARPFDCEKLRGVVLRNLEEAIRLHRAKTLVVSSFSSLPLREGMNEEESDMAFDYTYRTLLRLTKKYNIRTLVTT